MESEHLEKFEVWSEGYEATGDRAPHQFMGEAVRETFQEACIAVMNANRMNDVSFDAQNLTYWGCRLFPTKQEAIGKVCPTCSTVLRKD